MLENAKLNKLASGRNWQGYIDYEIHHHMITCFESVIEINEWCMQQPDKKFFQETSEIISTSY